MGARDDAFWAWFLGVEVSDWEAAGVCVRPHVGLAGYRGLWCFRRNSRVVVSVPPGWVARCNSLFQHAKVTELLDGNVLATLLGPDFDLSIGPAFQGCLEPAEFVPVATANVRRVDVQDDAVVRFRAECGADDWENGGIDKVTGSLLAHFEGARITAMAGYRAWRHDAGDPCVLTHPEFRSRGHGTAVVSAVASSALDQGHLLLFQTLESNLGSIGIASKLGYRQYATHIAVRLKRDAPQDGDAP